MNDQDPSRMVQRINGDYRLRFEDVYMFFEIKKKSSFCFDIDHIEEKSSGNTTSHSDISLLEYESFHFDLSIDPLPFPDRSDSHLEKFADELAYIISPPEEVKRFDPFFSLTQSGEKTRVMETPSFGFHHMLSSLPAAYSPTKVPPSPSLDIPEIKQLATKQGDEYGFVIRPCLVGVTFESVRIDL
ncbi:hypothetical protein Tco_0609940 [Tanacetum coccineum]